MRELLVYVAIGFTVITLGCIVGFGHFHNWTPDNTESWGYIIGGCMGLLVLLRVVKNWL